MLPAVASSQATQNVPPDHEVYSFIDRLVATRLVDRILVGQRMLSRLEVGRILAEARSRQGSDGSWMDRRLSEFSTDFPNDLTRAPSIGIAGSELTAADSPPRGIEPDGTGAIDVALNPILSNQLGRIHVDGTTLATWAGASAALGRSLVLNGRARVSGVAPSAGDRDTEAQVEQLYARAKWRNVALIVGRDHAFFGQGHSAGLTHSLNPRAVDQLRLSTDSPFTLPWILRYIGPAYATVMLGDLGEEQLFPHSRLFAYKVSVRPHRRFELGVGLSEEVGGQGAPGGTFSEKAQDAIPLLDALFLHRTFLFSNKFVAVDIRYTIPRVRGLQFYAEGAFDDFDIRRVRSVFTEDAGYVWGLSATCFAECGPVRATTEYHVTGLRYYTHGFFRGGYTVDDQIIGAQLGPRGKAGYGIVDVDRGATSWRLDLAYESRSGHKYGAVATAPEDADFRFVVLETRPTERRWRSAVSARHGLPTARVSYRVGVGLERVENFAHIDDAWRTNWMTQLAVEYRPFTRFHR